LNQNHLLILLSIFVVGSAMVLAFSPAQSSIPPTPAYSTINILNNLTWPNSSDASITALVYNDNWTLATDGSIIVNITSVNP
jgi:hypothetical protein